MDNPIDVLNAFYDAERRYMAAGGAAAGASFDEMASTLHPDVELHQSPDLPWGGEYRGHAGFREWSLKMSDAFDQLSVEDARFLVAEDKVVILCRLVTRARRSGDVLNAPMAQVVTVQNGRITEFRPFYWHVPDYVSAAGLAPGT
ncbi:nuclear transport factor 2 family protein [Mesorhizobium sp. M2A.F.Ca.ET.037.01.1.1]|uniref:nuclear transport factor 2 family protein n=1 Tax=unclassified Mesorhizobium TaxID=325217 RepID=UPI000F76248D|nr:MULTISPECIES: nuclear transport factor 2 family protein [unclassified Mesorhizobium]RUY13176.1 nuclear transport factor 2 family protein [Mesorhizobium sp. M2A.F.Ca.ET.040.01.1.1]RVC71063.1 nuclear transport factor 2 family protein [Mesorhizobium sp. M00.F.Ca.ET.038.03.1.1]RVC82589.1 nuclear transport factor 2 family protein [Mesorhizobium sp. M2A.F.Ca.ET.046.02.1.1]AZO34801.1 nuclear transport factor 2 family protein [Mesorhizobium sp. M2A.F.Ca.ET.046.03.2.1]RUX22683.1 nuclear transport fa